MLSLLGKACKLVRVRINMPLLLEVESVRAALAVSRDPVMASDKDMDVQYKASAKGLIAGTMVRSETLRGGALRSR